MTWRWLGWSMIFALVLVVMYALANRAVSEDWWLAISLVIPALAAFVIGVRFHSWWWVLAPPATVFVLLVALYVSLSGPPRPTAIGRVTSREEMLFGLLWVGPSLAGASLLLSAAAGVGVLWGKHRDEDRHPA